MIKNDIIDYDESIKREYESNCFNDKFFEIFPTKYEKMLREYEVIYFKDEVRISFFNLDFSDDMICYEECDFKANLPSHDPMIIYLCSPNNPTGTALNKKELTVWVKYAKQTGSVIFFDAAYEAFITEDIPHSIYEIEGAKEVAIEFHSFSKTAGFTGVRCGYVVVPKELKLETKSGGLISANELWYRRQCTKFNGCSYVVQRGAEAVYTEAGQKQIQKTLGIYRKNALAILAGVKEVGLRASGGINSPYIWVSVPDGMSSWDFFHFLLREAQVICTPGSGFGPCGEGYVRLTAFNTSEKTAMAVKRLKTAVKKYTNKG